jgi:SAM-dependent methyltransferase
LIVPGTSVCYVDRWNPDESRALFGELPGADFIQPDVVCNLDEDLLRAFADASQDFVICSHVLEHLANPLALLGDAYRVLRPSGVMLILLPDRHHTYDRTRTPTPLGHVVADYQAGVTEVETAHIEDCLLNADQDTVRAWREASSEDRIALVNLHRQRSIHVHCWDEPEFSSLLCYAIERLGQTWELVGGVVPDVRDPSAMEFGYVLRRSDSASADYEAGGRFRHNLEQLRQDRRRLQHDRWRPLGYDPQSPGAAVIRQMDDEIIRLEDEIRRLTATKLFRYSAPLRRSYGRLRRHWAGPDGRDVAAPPGRARLPRNGSE